MRMRRYMRGGGPPARIRNDDIRPSLGVMDITEHRLLWFGHGMRKTWLRLSLGLRVEGRRGGDRPKLPWEQVIRVDMLACG